MRDGGLTLVTPFFSAGSPERQRELDECLARNVEHPLFSRIVLLIDDGTLPPVDSPKIVSRNLSRRPRYDDWLDEVENSSHGSPVVLANSDIYFDETLALVHQALDMPDAFIALTRWEREGDEVYGHPNPHWSQDVWAIRSGNGLDQLRNRLNFELGVPRCDNKVAYVFAAYGWSVRNPCNFIKSYHLHETQARSYSKKTDTTIVGAVAYVEPNDALASESALHFDIWSLKTHNVVKTAMNTSLERWLAELPARQAAGEAHAERPRFDGQSADAGSRSDLFSNGRRIYSNPAGMAIYEKGEYLMAAPSLDPREWFVVEKTKALDSPALRNQFSPVIDAHLPTIGDRPKQEDDVNFWQYPCLTEKQAFMNHSAIEAPAIDLGARRIALYLPLPWATYIDNKCFPEEVLTALQHRLDFLEALARGLGFSVAVHTVCQHIRWRHMLEYALQLGVTDLWLSHCPADAGEELAPAGKEVRLHPWSLYAVNYCDETRSQGLVIGKPMGQRKYLASFVGAHMPHYLSDIRVRLVEELGALEAEDIVVELNGEWHFNQIVYGHQVEKKHMDDRMPVALEPDAARYNRLMSDSKMSLCPEGAGPNTLRLWESIAVGCVPVLFSRSVLFPARHSEDLVRLCLFWDGRDLGQEFYDWLTAWSDEELEERSLQLRALYSYIEKLTCL